MKNSKFPSFSLTSLLSSFDCFDDYYLYENEDVNKDMELWLIEDKNGLWNIGDEKGIMFGMRMSFEEAKAFSKELEWE